MIGGLQFSSITNRGTVEQQATHVLARAQFNPGLP